MRLGPVAKILAVLVALYLLRGAVSGFTNPIWLPGNERVCPGCVKQAREHKNRDLTFSFINPWQTVDNKVVYY
jgi:hypothetical protein